MCSYVFHVYVHADVVGLLSCKSRRPARASHAALPQSQTYRKSPENAKTTNDKKVPVHLHVLSREYSIQPLAKAVRYHDRWSMGQE